MTSARGPNRRTGDDRGSVLPYTLVTILGLLAAAGLVFDGGAATAVKARAIADAYAAARAGAQALAGPRLAATGTVTADPVAARRAALAYLAAVGAARGATVTVTGARVSVTDTLVAPTRLLDAFGLAAITFTGHGVATATYGVQPR